MERTPPDPSNRAKIATKWMKRQNAHLAHRRFVARNWGILRNHGRNNNSPEIALVGYFFWILYCRVVLEVLLAIFRMGEAIAPEGRHPQQQ
jgi:hypothetical protein